MGSKTHPPKKNTEDILFRLSTFFWFGSWCFRNKQSNNNSWWMLRLRPTNDELGGGFKYFLFSPLLREMIQFDYNIFVHGVGNHQLVKVLFVLSDYHKMCFKASVASSSGFDAPLAQHGTAPCIANAWNVTSHGDPCNWKKSIHSDCGINFHPLFLSHTIHVWYIYLYLP